MIERIRGFVTTALTISLSLYTLYEVNYASLAPMSQLAAFAMLGTMLCFMMYPLHPRFKDNQILQGVDLLLAAGTAFCCGYVVYEGQDLIVSLGDVEANLIREDRVRGETYAPGDRIRVIIVEVRKDGSRVKVLVSRTHPDLVRRLFELEVPEIADQIIEIKRVVREPGYRTKMAVLSSDPKIDAIGACVGVRGSRIKAVIDELRGERIDIIRWSDSLETLVMNGLGPAKIHLDNIYPHVDRHSVTVLVDEEQQSLAIGKRGQNVRLASRLCGWEIDIKTREEYFDDASAAPAEGEAAEAPEAPEAPADAVEAPIEAPAGHSDAVEEPPAPPAAS